MNENDQPMARTEIELVRQALEKGNRKRIRKILRGMHPGKVASLLESLMPPQRAAVWQQIDDDAEQSVLGHLSEDLRGLLTQDTESAEGAIEDETTPKTQLARLRDALERGKLKRVGRMLRQIHPAKVAGLLESLPPRERSTAWEMVESDRAGSILVHLHDEVRTLLAQEMDPEDLITAARGLELDDLADLIQDLPEATGWDLLRAMDLREREQLESILSYPEDSAGGLMNTDQISVRASLRVGSVLRYLRLLEDLPDHTDKVMVIDRQNRYQGVLPVRRLLTSRPEQKVKEVMDEAFPAFEAETPSHDVARRF